MLTISNREAISHIHSPFLHRAPSHITSALNFPSRRPREIITICSTTIMQCKQNTSTKNSPWFNDRYGSKSAHEAKDASLQSWAQALGQQVPCSSCRHESRCSRGKNSHLSKSFGEERRCQSDPRTLNLWNYPRGSDLGRSGAKSKSFRLLEYGWFRDLYTSHELFSSRVRARLAFLGSANLVLWFALTLLSLIVYQDHISFCFELWYEPMSAKGRQPFCWVCRQKL